MKGLPPIGHTLHISTKYRSTDPNMTELIRTLRILNEIRRVTQQPPPQQQLHPMQQQQQQQRYGPGQQVMPHPQQQQGRPVTNSPPSQPIPNQRSQQQQQSPLLNVPQEVDWGRLIDTNRPQQTAVMISRNLHANAGTIPALARKMTSPQHLAIIPHLEEPFRGKLRDEILQLVLKSLTSGGNEYLEAAGMLAELVNLQLVVLTGVASTLENLLQDPSTRKAACAVLGKLSMQAQNNAALRAATKHLAAVVSSVDDPELEYDISYITRTMGWKQPRVTLNHVRSIETPHKGSVISTAFFQQRDELVTGGSDGTVCVWGAPSFGDVPSSTFNLPQHSIPCSMDGAPRGNFLAVAVASLDSRAPQVHLYPVVELGKYGAAHKVNRPIGSAITGVKCLSIRNSAFCISERSAKGTHNIIFYSNAGDAVVRDIPEAHSDYITCQATSIDNETMLLTGSRDGTVKLWDTRAPKPQASNLSYHKSAVTSISTVRDVVATGSLDRKVALWDIRKLSAPTMEKKFCVPVLRVSCGVNATAVVSTTTTISVLTLDPLEVQDIQTNVCYHELRQNTETSVVFAAGEGQLVDMYSLNYN